MTSRVGDIHFCRPAAARTRIEADAARSRKAWRARRARLRRVAHQRPVPAAFHPELVSSTTGRLEEILLTIPEWLFGARKYANVYKDFFRKFPRHVRYVCVIQESKRPSLGRWIREFDLHRRVDIVSVRDTLDFTEWAEDPYVMVQDRGAGMSFFVEPRVFNRHSDNRIADFVAAKGNLGLLPSALVFQGGNVLIGDDFWFIGADHPRASRIRAGQGETEAQAAARVYGHALDRRRHLHIIGTDIRIPEHSVRTILKNGQQWEEQRYRGNKRGTRQPIFHIDMFISLAGRDADGAPVVLVGDPQMADEILDRDDRPEEAMYDAFHDIARQLARQRFHVIRNPLPLIVSEDATARERMWYFATSNNAIVQITPHRKTVWLPSYGYGDFKELAATDRVNRRIWRDLGFTVHMLTDFHAYAHDLGAAHCIKKYLVR
jgi:hypothetical protein